MTNRRKVLVGIILVVTLLGVGVGVWLWLNVSIAWQPENQLTNAQTRWQQQDIQDYRVWVQVQEPFATSGVYELTVEDGDVVDTALYNPLTFRYDPNAPSFEVPTNQAAGYTVEGLFGRARRLADDFRVLHLYVPSASHITYDPAYGYVQRYVNNTCGWALSVVEQCLTTLEVVRFEALD